MTRGDRMTLTEKWETCPTCDGNHRFGLYNDELEKFVTCPDCVDGLVPPEGMVRAAADEFWDLNFIRRILVAAKRWEKEC